jgi:hypothetical protein
MKDLFEQVLHHLEGEESHIQEWHTAEGIKALEVKTFGPERWIERVHDRGVMSALDCISMISFVLDDIGAGYSIEQRRELVEAWAEELVKAARDGEIKARNATTLLALPELPDGLDWLLSMADADAFLTARGMEWKCREIAAHLYNQSIDGINKLCFPPELFFTGGDTQKSPQAAPIELSNQTGMDWVTQARAIAIEYIARHKAQDLFPNQKDVSDEVEEKLRVRKIYGTHGKPVSANYIVRNAIGGEWWNKNKP